MSTEQPTEIKRSWVASLVNRFMKAVEEVADDADWAESDGWVGRMLLRNERGQQSYVYEIRDGKMLESNSQGPFIATIRMSVDTFLDLINAATSGVPRKAELLFERKYAAKQIAYDGERWIVDSERFRKVFKRLGATTGKGVSV